MNGGFLAQHKFQKTPPMETTCASCHGGRIFGEFTGLNKDLAADTHFDDEEMTCMDCHKAGQMHGAAAEGATRQASAKRPRCEDCHAEAAADAATPSHRIHQGKVACQVCHAQPIKQCYSCHVGTDAKGIAFFKCKTTELDFKIGRNPQPTPERPYVFTVKHHPPVVPETFNYYSPGALQDFARYPTWTDAAPHSIRRVTPQNKACNNCHGQRALFLDAKDLAAWEIAANAAVVVPDDQIPPALEADALPPN